jgi:hypothetical protein
MTSDQLYNPNHKLCFSFQVLPAVCGQETAFQLPSALSWKISKFRKIRQLTFTWCELCCLLAQLCVSQSVTRIWHADHQTHCCTQNKVRYDRQKLHCLCLFLSMCWDCPRLSCRQTWLVAVRSSNGHCPQESGITKQTNPFGR